MNSLLNASNHKPSASQGNQKGGGWRYEGRAPVIKEIIGKCFGCQSVQGESREEHVQSGRRQIGTDAECIFSSDPIGQFKQVRLAATFILTAVDWSLGGCAAGIGIFSRFGMTDDLNAVAATPDAMVLHHLYPDGKPDDIDRESDGNQFSQHNNANVATLIPMKYKKLLIML
jgi:hypothetical protein